jgi:serine/threonine protein kinase
MPPPDPDLDAKRSAAQPAASPSFGPFKLQRLLGKSAQTLVWLANDPRVDAERVLVMPRAQAADGAHLQRHLQVLRKATRVAHPGLAMAVEVGEHDRWPYIAYERGASSTLTERVASRGVPALDAARWSVQVLHGLAFAHEAGLAHRDLQAAMVSIDETGGAHLLGLEAAALSHDPLVAQAEPAQRDRPAGAAARCATRHGQLRQRAGRCTAPLRTPKRGCAATCGATLRTCAQPEPARSAVGGARPIAARPVR